MKFVGPWTVHGCTVHRRPVKSCGYCSCTVHEQCRLLGERREKKKKKKQRRKLKTQQTQRGSKLSLRCGSDTSLRLMFCANAHFTFSFFFFFGMLLAQQNWRCGYCLWTVANFSTHFQPHQWVMCTVHGTHKLHFSSIFSLKIGPTVLFTHLKIILLQYFQFSFFSF